MSRDRGCGISATDVGSRGVLSLQHPVGTMEESETIFKAVTRFRRSRSLMDLLAVLRMIVAKKRSIEVLYGAYSFALNRPGTLSPDNGLDVHETLRTAESLHRQTRELQLRTVEKALESCRFRDQFIFRYHGFQFTSDGFIAGEYGEANPRLLVSSGDDIAWHRPYNGESGVRHIHVVMEYQENTFVTTGDSNKFVDRYSSDEGGLRFEHRVMRHFGGFCAACVVDGNCWFGSDFTGRPNYLMNFRTGKKYFFPGVAYTQFCDLFLPIDNRLLVCLNKDLTYRRTISIFDLQRAAFVFSEEQFGNSYF